jgi:glutamate-ammonia-ligase adenylyltransferase
MNNLTNKALRTLVMGGGSQAFEFTSPSMQGVQRLVSRGLMKAETATQLAEGYTFLRRVEHRIQFLDDQQTHLLPANDDDLAWIAESLRAGCTAVSESLADKPACALLDHLGSVREFVAAEFDTLLKPGAGADGAPSFGQVLKSQMDKSLDQLCV